MIDAKGFGRPAVSDTNCRVHASQDVLPNVNGNGPDPVVVVLPYSGDKVLMQLRDDIPAIPFPGHWGFFGGSVKANEHPDDTAVRELQEELGLSTTALTPMGMTCIVDLDDLESHAYYFQLETPLEDIVLCEGMDFGLFTINDIQSGTLRSPKLGLHYPVIANPYLARTFGSLLEHIRFTLPPETATNGS